MQNGTGAISCTPLQSTRFTLLGCCKSHFPWRFRKKGGRVHPYCCICEMHTQLEAYRMLRVPLFLTWLMFSTRAQAQAPWIQTKPHRNVCTMPYTTMDVCGSVNGSVDGYTGYEIEV